MAVTTGTPWDLALDQSAHRATPSSPPTPVPALTAGSRARHAVQAISPRAAFQDILYHRATVVDIRGEPAWNSGEDTAGVPDAAVVAPHTLITWLVQRTDSRPVILLSDDGVQAAHIAQGLADVALAFPAFLDGGFAAWRAAGLPTT